MVVVQTKQTNFVITPSMTESNAIVYVTLIEWNNKSINNQSLNRLMGILPPERQAKLRKFYHAEDSWRSLIGQLLPRYWLRQKQVSLDVVRFEATEHGKPIIAQSPVPLTYNVTHDSDMVAIACGSGESVGIDLMRVALPRRTSMNEFVDFVSEQLTAREKEALDPRVGNEATRLLRLYRMWTVKEAYTKALGEGLGYDFARIEYDVLEGTVTVDGKPPSGWEIVSFLVRRIADTYVISTARRVGEEGTAMLHLEDAPKGLVEFIELDTLAECLVPSTDK
ncbi:L-aminoadipate-semialdehyde dehydrogenase-phosphopantetheinyl transferase OS=Mus musculus GN=Aasdhppt PE=2 SV=1 [Rhizoctonia solani AG-1 IB]|uniref:holo-[acyl-carrier-protein] synthase n=1 Tax=Thanatephorus cucumeris (strain AG1-IB / isolate 7/3/14) TaxID=1108050 RepID=A0A0B7FJJ7_THACB|nr:L-aminoadipate-semialdehyde dehydrogenase-phosphopantetheinyl transferase OS=Mus musculus GN=Aasdhppt PE=2 SV=1 [Rhizoctonia solani AG-1 IB]